MQMHGLGYMTPWKLKEGADSIAWSCSGRKPAMSGMECHLLPCRLDARSALLLPIIEGSQVSTKYGNVSTDYILFICSGAFHQCKPSDSLSGSISPPVATFDADDVPLPCPSESGVGNTAAYVHNNQCRKPKSVQSDFASDLSLQWAERGAT